MIYPVLAVLNLVVNIGKWAINGLSASGPDGTLFLNKTGDLSDVYATDITPAGWTFSIWGFIYTWEALWMTYALVNVCRRGSDGPAYANPVFIPCMLLITNMVAACLNVGWLLSFDRQEIILSFVILVLYSLTYYSMVAMSYVALDRASPKLADQGRTLEIWLTRAFVQNGLAAQATWVSIATMLNLAMVSTYKVDNPLSMVDAATVSLSILTVLIVVFATTDLVFLDRYSRYTLTPYIVLLVGLIGSLSKNYKEGARNSVFTVVLVSLVGVLVLIKLVITVIRHAKGSRYSTAYDTTIGGSSRKGNLA